MILPVGPGGVSYMSPTSLDSPDLHLQTPHQKKKKQLTAILHFLCIHFTYAPLLIFLITHSPSSHTNDFSCTKSPFPHCIALPCSIFSFSFFFPFSIVHDIHETYPFIHFPFSFPQQSVQRTTKKLPGHSTTMLTLP